LLGMTDKELENFEKWWYDFERLWRTAANKMFLQWCRDGLVLSFIFVQRLVSGTGRGFGKAPLQKHKRWLQGLLKKS
jgi:hypothetical protein